jgi:non-homologous end joining protein Ku
MCPNLRYKGEMLELVRDIIKTKQGAFHLARFDGRYEKALARIVKAKRERKTIGAPKRHSLRGSSTNCARAAAWTLAKSQRRRSPETRLLRARAGRLRTPRRRAARRADA